MTEDKSDNIDRSDERLRDLLRDYNINHSIDHNVEPGARYGASSALGTAALADSAREEMWRVIEERSFGREASNPARDNIAPGLLRRVGRREWLRYAALLLAGIAIGGTGVQLSEHFRDSGLRESRNAILPHASRGAPASFSVGTQSSTLRYLGEAVALLTSFESDALPVAAGGSVDDSMRAQAANLLFTTRLLLDDPDSSSAEMRELLEDLELILVQIVQTPVAGDPTDLEPIRGTVADREVVPRLIAAAATSSKQERDLP